MADGPEDATDLQDDAFDAPRPTIGESTGAVKPEIVQDTRPPGSPLELIAALATIVVADFTIYRGGGYSGWAVSFALLAPLMFVASRRRAWSGWTLLLFGLILLLSARLSWLGSDALIAAGAFFIIGFGLAIAGRAPCIGDFIPFVAQLVPAGFLGLIDYRTGRFANFARPSRSATWSLLMPMLAVLVFGIIFLMANPDLAHAINERVQLFVEHIWSTLAAYCPQGSQIIFWCIVAIIFIGLVRPLVWPAFLDSLGKFSSHETPAEITTTTAPALYHAAYRNTLIALVALFTVYLAFEFKTLWFREFPSGFHYSGYAHEGAAWLTVALALATATLSWMFRGHGVDEPRKLVLLRLAWVWSALNFLLAVAVYHRLMIYVDFNGMTRMRVVGFLGVTAVVIGFALVVYKISRGRSFIWLIRRQLWTLALMIYLFVVAPVDYLAHSYNVRRILAGDPAPAVQLSVHPIDDGGLLALPAALQSDNAVIREGARAILSERLEEFRSRCPTEPWDRHQFATEQLEARLTEMRDELDTFIDIEARRKARAQFDEYVYQWF
ncbi:DUF4153 domain-containing protein [Stratiformator vulcanicus]|uniref:Uncharacterized protein n=1 Tax=Stratiformator vulcanicus TaxID=2527980 RepID=A0A517QYH8_9PLAN|nr:DUF4153 domain-containing protein [Stratiformator vulcanicus]QDT36692.1 hypothetical protein Pan189_10540 [Stratiformator vulcanicus]